MSFSDSLLIKGIVGTTVIATPVTLVSVFSKSKGIIQRSSDEILTNDKFLLEEINNFEKFKKTKNGDIEIKRQPNNKSIILKTISTRPEYEDYNYKLKIEFIFNENPSNKWSCNIEGYKEIEIDKLREKLGFSGNNGEEFSNINKENLKNMKKIVEICSSESEKDFRDEGWLHDRDVDKTTATDDNHNWLIDFFQ